MTYSIASQISKPGAAIADKIVLAPSSVLDQVQTSLPIVDKIVPVQKKVIGTATSIAGKSAWEYARDGGYPGTEEQFAADLARIDKTIELGNIYQLPSPLGNSRTLYVISDEGASYVWLEDALRYVCVGRDYEKISVINGNK